jgi:hypothetical protein
MLSVVALNVVAPLMKTTLIQQIRIKYLIFGDWIRTLSFMNTSRFFYHCASVVKLIIDHIYKNSQWRSVPVLEPTLVNFLA